MEGELVRIERRLAAVEVLLRQMILTQQQLLTLLTAPTTYPASTGGTVKVT